MYSQGNENYTGIAARDTANALKNLTASVRGVAATSRDQELQDKILEYCAEVMEKSAGLIEEAKKAVNNPNNPDNQTRLAMVRAYVDLIADNASRETLHRLTYRTYFFRPSATVSRIANRPNGVTCASSSLSWRTPPPG